MLTRLNAPELVDYYAKKQIGYRNYWKIPGYSDPADPRYVFRNKAGDCLYISTFVAAALRKNGYNAWVAKKPALRACDSWHAVCVFKDQGERYIIDDGKGYKRGIMRHDEYKGDTTADGNASCRPGAPFRVAGRHDPDVSPFGKRMPRTRRPARPLSCRSRFEEDSRRWSGRPPASLERGRRHLCPGELRLCRRDAHRSGPVRAELGQSLQSRLLAIPLNVAIARPYGIYRDWLFRATHAETGNRIARTLVDILAFSTFMLPQYAAVLWVGGRRPASNRDRVYQCGRHEPRGGKALRPLHVPVPDVAVSRSAVATPSRYIDTFHRQTRRNRSAHNFTTSANSSRKVSMLTILIRSL